MNKKNHVGIIVFLLMVTIFSASLFVPSAQSATYPERAITFIVPNAAGGRTDLAARFIAQFLKEYLGQPIVIVNKPGASTLTGTTHVINSKPDGYTLLVTGPSLMTAPYMVKTNISFMNLDPVVRLTYDPSILVINPNKIKVKDLKEFIAYAKANPNVVIMGIDPGGSNELNTMAFAKTAGIQFRLVPYKGGGERIVALSGGHVDAMFDVPVTVKSMVQAGKARILGVGSRERFQDLKDIETWKEAGVDLEFGSWAGLFAPKGTPAPILKALQIASEKTAKNPEFLKTLTGADTYLGYLAPNDFAKALAEEDQFIKRTCEISGIMPQ